MYRVTRRGLLRSGAGLALGYWASRFLPDHYDPVFAQNLQAPEVVVAEGTDEDSAEVLLRTSLAPLGGIERFVKPGQTVAIKPNATWDRPPHTASSTDPELLRALIEMVKAAGAARIIVMDHSVFDPPPYVLDVTQLGPMLEEEGVEVHMLDRFVEPKSKYQDIDIPAGKAFQSIGVIKVALEADVRINMAVAKTHIVLPVTLCCKHMMGYLESPPGLHVNLDQGIADILNAPGIHSDLHILEAIRVRVRGPAYGDGTDLTDPSHVKRMNQVIAGTDPVLIDAYATTNYFGRSPMEITHIKRAFESGVGQIDVEAAVASGRLQSFRPQDIKPTPTPTATATLTPTPASTGVPMAENTSTPEPSATPAPTATPTSAPRRRIIDGEVLDVNPLLDAPLVPLAAIVGGAGVVVGRRLAGNLRGPVKRSEGEASAGRDDEDGERGARRQGDEEKRG